MEAPKRLGDIPVRELYPDAERIEMAEILDKEIIVLDMTLLKGDLGEFAVFTFTFDADQKSFSTSCGGYKLVQRLVEAKEQGWFPLRAKVTKVDRTYEVS